ncbi:MAG: suppressor of fused domain protein [Crocinitomicaceae bacterium]
MVEKSLLEQAFKNSEIDCSRNISIRYYQPFNHSHGVLYTKGLSNKNQHELANRTENIHSFIELYFLLPSHWNLANENQKWPIEVLKRIIDAQTEKNSWFGPGDTIPAHAKSANSEKLPTEINSAEERHTSINSIFKHTHFMFTEPIEGQAFLQSVQNEDEFYNWLGVIPIFEEEFAYKNSRSALELIMNFEKKKITELVDEFRPLGAKKKFFGLF